MLLAILNNYSVLIRKFKKGTAPRHENLKLILLLNNAKPHVDKLKQKAIMDLNWEVLPHPAYSTDLAPSDHHLIRSLQHALRDTSFESKSGLENLLSCLF